MEEEQRLALLPYAAIREAEGLVPMDSFAKRAQEAALLRTLSGASRIDMIPKLGLGVVARCRNRIHHTPQRRPHTIEARWFFTDQEPVYQKVPSALI